MGEKLGKVKALVVEFSAEYAAIRAKSGEGGYSEAVDSWGKAVYASQAPVRYQTDGLLAAMGGAGAAPRATARVDGQQ